MVLKIGILPILDVSIRPSDQIDEGQFGIGSPSSRLYFDGRATTLKDTKVRGYIEMDFRGSVGVTIRHAYLQFTNKRNQSILMGQYWTNIMDLQATPEGLVEPTVSGATFSRHGQIRFTQPLKSFGTVSISVEDPSRGDFNGVNFIPYNKIPDFTCAINLNASKHIHFSVSQLLRFPELKNMETLKTYHTTGYLTSSAFIAKNSTTNLAIIGSYGKSVSPYLLGREPSVSGT